MGSFVNPDNSGFVTALNTPVFVDKSMIIEKLNNLIPTENNRICVSRPRRFGKTRTAELLVAYYSTGCDSRALFDKLNISKVPDWDKYMNKMNVIQIDAQAIYQVAKEEEIDFVSEIKLLVNEELKESFPDIDINVDEPLVKSIMKIYKATHIKFVIIIDEYDVVVRAKCTDYEIDKYLGFLNTLFKNKNVRNAIALAYLTGILPIIRDTFQSKLNVFTEYSITKPGDLSGFIGFTEDEVKVLCSKYNMDFEFCKNWYDGYKLENLESIYNPCSVVNAMSNHYFDDYWTGTGSFESITDYIGQNIDGLHDDIRRMIEYDDKIKVDISFFLNKIDDFKSKDEIYAYLIHLGYLTYDAENKKCYIPNDEIREEWRKAIRSIGNLTPFYEFYTASKELYEGILKLDSNAVAHNLDKIHFSSANPKTFSNEAALHTSVVSALTYSKAYYNLHDEESTGYGIADVVLIPRFHYSKNPAIIIELKVDKSAEVALNQIKEKKYGQDFECYKNNMIFIGINYNKKSKHHECKIERFTF